MQISQTSIFDLSGKKILDQASKSSSLDIERLARGIYFVQVATNNGIFTQKFIKK
jgi:hypothetical protein